MEISIWEFYWGVFMGLVVMKGRGRKYDKIEGEVELWSSSNRVLVDFVGCLFRVV